MGNVHNLNERLRRTSASRRRVNGITKSHVAYLNAQAQADADKEEDDRNRATVVAAWKNAVARAYSIFGAEETDRLMPFVHSAMKPNEE